MRDWTLAEEAADAALPLIDPDEPELFEELWRWLLLPAAALAGAVCGLVIWQAAAPEQVRRPVLPPSLSVTGPTALAALTAPPPVQRAFAPAPAAVPALAAPSLPAFASPAAPPPRLQPVRRADFAGLKPTPAVRRLADWAVDANDPRGLPFAIVDKLQARVWVFRPDGQLAGSAPILLGYARGDASVPGIGERKLAEVRPHERTTPAGRFVAEHGRNTKGEDIVWVDYDAAVSMHRVRATNPAEMRLQRLASRTPADNRISYGCINVPTAFYDRVLARTFGGPRAIVYVLPETQPLVRVFQRVYDVDARERRLARELRGLPRIAQLASR